MARIQTLSRSGPKGFSGAEGASQFVRTKGKQALTGKGEGEVRMRPRVSSAAKDGRLFGWFEPTEEGFVTLYKAPVMTQVEWVKSGVGARDSRIAYRIGIDTPDYEADDLSGKGAEITGGRGNQKGIAVIYAAENRSLACLETLAHLGGRRPSVQPQSCGDFDT